MSPNTAAQLATKEYYDMLVDIEYEQFEDDMYGNEELLMHSSQSRDVEELFYGSSEDESYE
mgnify:CR=1 FL=1|jgi:hypothetical protein